MDNTNWILGYRARWNICLFIISNSFLIRLYLKKKKKTLSWIAKSIFVV